MAKKHTFTFDFDQTITNAPKQLAVIADALRAQGHTVYVLTGNQSPKNDLLKQLDDYGFKHDGLVQYDDSGSDGVSRAEYLKQLDTWLAFDNRIDRAFIFAKVCPHLYLMTEPTDVEEDEAKDAKKDAKKDVKKLKRTLLQGGAADGQHHEHSGLASVIEIRMGNTKHLYRIHPSTGDQSIADYMGEA